jgi:predicted RNA binding protein YcfA (HicA-like mRNA interferase family)
MPRKFPSLTPDEVIDIMKARGFVLDRTRGGHAYYLGSVRGEKRLVTVSVHYREFGTQRINDMIDQSGLTREEFYGSTKHTAKKINLVRGEYPIPLK